jgi:hypothetical protein
MTLQASDFAGSHAEGQAGAGGGAVASAYERVITLAHPYGASRYRVLDSIALVGVDLRSALRLYHQLGRELSSRSQRVGLLRNLLTSTGLASEVHSARLVTPRGLGVDDSSMEAGFEVVLHNHKRVDVSLTIVRVDRVIDANLALGSGSVVARKDGVALTQLEAGHIADGLVPDGLALPIVTGTVAPGQVLTVSAGTWRGTPATFAYQWQRCDGAGANCADVPGATGVVYRVGGADAGTTLRAKVTATSRFGSGVTASAPTALVP